MVTERLVEFPHWYLSRTMPVTVNAKRLWLSRCYVVLPFGRRHWVWSPWAPDLSLD